MAAKIAKYMGFGVFGLLILMVGALFVINDKTIEASVGPLAPPALSLKHGILGAFSSATGALDSEGNSKTPRVVQDMPPAPAPEALATPVQTRSLSEIAAENQQVYNQRDSASANLGGQVNDQTRSPANEPATPKEIAALADQSDTPSTDAPPSPPTMAGTDINTNAPVPLDSAPAAPANLGTDTPASEPQTSEMALLESLEQQPTDDVAALPPETTEEIEVLESAVDENPDPQGELAYAEGLKYYSGEGVDRNFGTAAQYFMKAAEQGHSEAQYSLGLMNYVGQTGGQDFSNAAKWFQLAAESGHIQAQYNLGFLYYEGKGVQQDLKTAYGWIDRAAQQGYAKAVKARDALQKAMPEMFGS